MLAARVGVPSSQVYVRVLGRGLMMGIGGLEVSAVEEHKTYEVLSTAFP